jgi:hypothetical protein
MDIFDIEPTLPNVPADCGPEPSLRTILIRYYEQAFDIEGSIKHANLYIKAIAAQGGE